MNQHRRTDPCAGAVGGPSAAIATLVAVLLAGAVFGIVWQRIYHERGFPFAVPMSATVMTVLLLWIVLDAATVWT